MRFLADESIDVAIIRALRMAGHDVWAIAEDGPGMSDEGVANLANTSQAVLLTEDRDFGRLAYASTHKLGGVIYMRYPARPGSAFIQAVLDLISSEGGRLKGAFVVIQPGRIRVGRLPE